jgi:hypothetical protein
VNFRMRLSRLDGALRAQSGCGLSAAAHLQLLQQIVHVILDGRSTDRQLAGDFLVGATLVYQCQISLSRWERDAGDRCG